MDRPSIDNKDCDPYEMPAWNSCCNYWTEYIKSQKGEIAYIIATGENYGNDNFKTADAIIKHLIGDNDG